MQMTTDLLIVNPCDEEEDNLAMLCCTSAEGEMFLMSRFPDEDELEIIFHDKPSALNGVKVTLSPDRLLIEIAAVDADALQRSMTLMTDLGYVKSRIDVRKYLDKSIVAEASGRLR